MENNSTVFTQLNRELFDRVDLMIENDDNKAMCDILYSQFEDMKCIDKDDFFATIVPVSIISSIVCNLEEDFVTDQDGFPIDNCKAIYFSEFIEDLILDGRFEEVMEYVESELINRERYELLSEMKKYEKNS